MDFVMGLPRTPRGIDCIWVIVDRLTKSAHFLPVRSTFSAERLAYVYIQEIVRLHGVSVSIISDRGYQFTSSFWKAFQRELGTRVKLSIAFHPQTDGQLQCTIQVLYHSSIQMASFEALYGRHCRTPVGWFESSEPRSYNTDLLQESLARARGVMSFGRRGKLNTRYIEPFEILRKVGDVAYELALLLAFSAIHPIFHLSMLRWYIPDKSHVLQYDSVELDDRLTFVEEPIAILARDVCQLRSRSIPVVKIQW
ncbi:uncharacterized protein LOC125869783 [Solanum stenotomum]|uniref:uncharacterized protein LOC125869783 n=1 Tax=Solanum stenotomum TaxID=172797 RepID=UPI0020D15E8C|nr:uncharacterized protein LOC125869783 [Solanum stenotomum]